MNNTLYGLLVEHVGHDVSVHADKDTEVATLECEECGCVIMDSDLYSIVGMDDGK